MYIYYVQYTDKVICQQKYELMCESYTDISRTWSTIADQMCKLKVAQQINYMHMHILLNTIKYIQHAYMACSSELKVHGGTLNSNYLYLEGAYGYSVISKHQPTRPHNSI